MKTLRILLLIFSLLKISSAEAQLSAQSYKSKDFDRFRSSKTYVILSGIPAFDQAIQDAMKESWKITSYSTVDNTELKTKIKDESASFIGLILIGEPNRGYHYLALFNGGKKSIRLYEYEDMIAYCPINRWVDEPELTDCAWRVRNMIESMVKTIQMMQETNLNGSTLGGVKDLREFYNKRAPQIKDRTLLVAESSMGKKWKKEWFTENYPFKYEFCDRKKIEKAIQERSKAYYYLQPGITLNKSWFVFDPSNGETLYWNFDAMGLAINEKNIKQMVEDIKK